MTTAQDTPLFDTLARPRTDGRSRITLDGAWDFRMEGQDTWRLAEVPSPWQALFDDLRHSSGTALYRRRFVIPADWSGRQVALCFGAVSYRAEVSFDGRLLGVHEGGYLPFEFVLPNDRPGNGGEHVVEVRVTLPSCDVDQYPDAPFQEFPHGKQSWYGPLGGIWQSVHLEARNPHHIVGCRIRADRTTGNVQALVRIKGGRTGEVTAVVYGPDGVAVADVSAPLDAWDDTAIALRVAAPKPWSPEEPNLYRLELRLTRDGETVDLWSDSFGFRTIEARDGQMFLNGKPLYLRAALDQDYYPDGICTPPSLAFLEDQFRKAKQLGLNCLRCHIKVPDPRYYEVADRLGLLIWTELPNVDHLTPMAAARARDTLQGILERDGNHPSIVIWTIINEDWGTQLPEDEDHRRWLVEMYDWLKALDPTRLVVDNSPCIPNFHVKTDINDYHYYRCLPERRAEWDRLTEEFAGAAPWTFSPCGDAQQSGKEPLIVSEFGVWGLPHPALLKNPDGSEPWWMETGQTWGDGTAYPHGLEERFAVLRLDRVFGSFDRFIEAVQWHQFENLKYEIESIRRYPSISGYVVTEFTDVHWEANGLMDMRRNLRVFHERFAEINADVVIVPTTDRWAFWCGETVEIDLSVASGMTALPAGCTLEWTVDEGTVGGRLPVGAVEPPAVLSVGRIGIATVEAAAPARLRIAFVLRDPAGDAIARNQIDVSVYPKTAPDASIRLWSPHAEIRDRLRSLGYTAASGQEDADVVLIRSADAADIEAIRLGGHYLMLAAEDPGQATLRSDAPPAQPPFFPKEEIADAEGTGHRKTATGGADRDRRFPNIGLCSRDGTMWRGDWITSFSWLRRHGAFADIPGGPLLDLSFDRIVPHHVLTGFQPWEFEARVHAGVFVGWGHKPAAFIGERPFGKGKLVMTTFRLTQDAPGQDPVATHLLDALIRTARAR